MHINTSLIRTLTGIALESFKVAFLSLVVVPATVTALVIAASSAWSVDGVAADIVRLMAETQQLGHPANPTDIRLNRCRDKMQPAQRLPQKIICSEYAAVDLPISEVAASASTALRRLYLMLAAISLLLVLGYRTLKQPSSPQELPNLNLTA